MMEAHEAYFEIRRLVLPIPVLAKKANSFTRDEMDGCSDLLEAVADTATRAYNRITSRKFEIVGDAETEKFEAESLLRAIALTAATAANVLSGAGSCPAKLNGDPLAWTADVDLLSGILWARFESARTHGVWAERLPELAEVAS